jgi:hypothetical protein
MSVGAETDLTISRLTVFATNAISELEMSTRGWNAPGFDLAYWEYYRARLFA